MTVTIPVLADPLLAGTTLRFTLGTGAPDPIEFLATDYDDDVATYTAAATAFEAQVAAGNTAARLTRTYLGDADDLDAAPHAQMVRTAGDPLRALIIPASGVRVLQDALDNHASALAHEDEFGSLMSWATDPAADQLASICGQSEVTYATGVAVRALLAEPVVVARHLTVTPEQDEALALALAAVALDWDEVGPDAMRTALAMACGLLGVDLTGAMVRS